MRCCIGAEAPLLQLFQLVGNFGETRGGAGLVFVTARRATDADGADGVLADLHRQTAGYACR